MSYWEQTTRERTCTYVCIVSFVLEIIEKCKLGSTCRFQNFQRNGNRVILLSVQSIVFTLTNPFNFL
jgi:hypothetical protein